MAAQNVADSALRFPHVRVFGVEASVNERLSINTVHIYADALGRFRFHRVPGGRVVRPAPDPHDDALKRTFAQFRQGPDESCGP